MPKTEEEFKDIFKTYEFEGVIYFSNYLTFHGTMEGEIETLRKLLHYYKGNLNSRLLYITGPDSLYEDTTGKTLMVRSAEEFCRQYGELHQIAVKILRVPYLYSGAIRNHNLDIMVKAFEIAGYTEEDLKEKFGALYNAFQYGAPPHAGMAPGVDRMIMLLRNEENIREVIPFPMNGNAQDVMCGAPNEVSEMQLREVHIKVRK